MFHMLYNVRLLYMCNSVNYIFIYTYIRFIIVVHVSYP